MGLTDDFAEQAVRDVTVGAATMGRAFVDAGCSPAVAGQTAARIASAIGRVLATPAGHGVQRLMRHAAALEGSPGDDARREKIERKWRGQLAKLAATTGETELAALFGAAQADGAEHG